jgi:hypothetical protein
MTDSETFAKRTVTAIVAFTVFAEFLAMITAIPRFGLAHLPRQLVRLAFESILCLALYRRRNWARIVVGVVGILAVLATVAFVLNFHQRLSLAAILLLTALTVGEVALAGVLLFSPSVKGYFRPDGVPR